VEQHKRARRASEQRAAKGLVVVVKEGVRGARREERGEGHSYAAAQQQTSSRVRGKNEVAM